MLIKKCIHAYPTRISHRALPLQFGIGFPSSPEADRRPKARRIIEVLLSVDARSMCIVQRQVIGRHVMEEQSHRRCTILHRIRRILIWVKL
jgi:hypothetical protein